jgi:hypothetical protein
VDKVRSEAYVIILAVGLILTLSSWILFMCIDKRSSGVVSFIAFVFQLVGWGGAVAAYIDIVKTLTPNREWTLWIPYFGPGLYLGGVSCVLLLVCGSMAVHLGRRRSSVDAKGKDMAPDFFDP